MSTQSCSMSDTQATPAESHSGMVYVNSGMYTGVCEPLGKIAMQATYKGIHITYPSNTSTGEDKLLITWWDVKRLALKSCCKSAPELKIKLKFPLRRNLPDKYLLQLDGSREGDFLGELQSLGYIKRQEAKWWEFWPLHPEIYMSCIPIAHVYMPNPQKRSAAIAKRYLWPMEAFMEIVDIKILIYQLIDKVCAQSQEKEGEATEEPKADALLLRNLLRNKPELFDLMRGDA